MTLTTVRKWPEALNRFDPGFSLLPPKVRIQRANAKLSEREVREIREALTRYHQAVEKCSPNALAAQYGVSAAVIRKIDQGERWRDVR